ncbi:MAG: tetratricopeptide repeat protein [Prosthecobacter sp.]
MGEGHIVRALRSKVHGNDPWNYKCREQIVTDRLVSDVSCFGLGTQRTPMKRNRKPSAAPPETPKTKLEATLPWAILVLLGSVLAIVGQSFGIWDRFKPVSSTVLEISLGGSRLSPPDGYPKKEWEGRKVLTHSARADLGLNVGQGTGHVVIRSLRVECQYEAQPLPELAYTADPNLIHGQGPQVTDVLEYRVDLDGSKVEPGMRLGVGGRTETSRSDDLLDLQPPKRLGVSRKMPAEVRLLLQPKKFGIYTCRVHASYTVDGKDAEASSDEIIIYRQPGLGEHGAGTHRVLNQKLLDAISFAEKDDARGVELYRQLAGEGNALAQHYLGQHYASGIQVERNIPTALGYFRQAADQGHPLAWIELGTAHMKGDLQPVGEAAALPCYLNAAWLGSTSAMVRAAVKLNATEKAEDVDTAYIFLRWAWLLHETGKQYLERASLDKSIAIEAYFCEDLEEGAKEAAMLIAITPFPALDADDAARIGRLLISHAPRHADDPLPERSLDLKILTQQELVRRIRAQGNIGFAGLDGSRAKLGLKDVWTRNRAPQDSAIVSHLLHHPDYQMEAEQGRVSPMRPRDLVSCLMPGDFVLLSDDRSAHYSTVLAVDAARDRVTFIDPWPRLFRFPGIKHELLPLDYQGQSYGKEVVVLGRASLEGIIKAVITQRSRG